MKNFLKSKYKNTSEVAEWTPARWRGKDKLVLCIILLLAAFFRFYGLNWDQGHHLHPDERMIVMVTAKIHLPQTSQEWQALFTPESPLNPQFFAYGSLPIYLLKFMAWIFSSFDPKWASYSHINLLGRALSGLADLGTIGIIYLIGKKIWSKKIGLLGGLFYALAVFPIQAAHFYAVDTLLTFFIVITLYRLVLFYDQPSSKNALLTGIFFGLSLSTKISATILIAPIGVALITNLIVKKEKINLAVIGLTTIVFFLIFEPYALIDFPTFWQQTQQQHQMTKSAFTFPYTLQYVDTVPYWYHLKNLILWGMGMPLGVLSLLGSLILLIRLAIETFRPGKANQEAKALVLISFFLAYFFVVGRFAIKFMRYLLPLYPIFCLFGAWLWIQITDFLKKKLGKKTVFMFLCFYVFMILVWPLSFITIYSKPNTRVTASQWFEQNVSQGSKIATEHWDDRIPMWGDYQFLEMPMYEPDSSAKKWQKVNQNLKEADYLVLASNRLYVPLPKLNDCQKYPNHCYPKTTNYYQKLFSGQLGFKKIAEFTSYPSLEFIPRSGIPLRGRVGSWEFNDSSADESFTVYDHPKIMIFKKIK